MSAIQKPQLTICLTLSEAAREQVQQFMVREQIIAETAGLRISASPGGCSGFRYWLNIEEHPLPTDQVIDQNGLRVFLDEASAICLNGAEIDFVSTGDASGFKVNNPNEPTTCGCDCSEQCPA